MEKLTLTAEKFAEQIKSQPSNDLAKRKLLKILNFYEYQRANGIDRIEAFQNSIYTPTIKENKKNFFGKRNRTKKRSILEKFSFIVVEKREANYSDRKIAAIINAMYVKKKDYFNAMYINRYRKEKGIK